MGMIFDEKIDLKKEKSWIIVEKQPIELFVEKSWSGRYYTVKTEPVTMRYETFIDLDSFGKVDISTYDYEDGMACFTSYTLDLIKEWGEKNKDRIIINYSKLK